MVGVFVTRKRIIKEIATDIAELQKHADEVYYRDNPPKEKSNDLASFIVDKVTPLKELAQRLGICKEVYAEAHKIYDFRNSGKKGYTLKNGKIQPV